MNVANSPTKAEPSLAKQELAYPLANSAKWREACHLKFSQSKLAKKQKQLQEHNVLEGALKKSRRSGDHKEVCDFCEERDGKLHECTTFQIDLNIREMATAFGDTDQGYWKTVWK